MTPVLARPAVSLETGSRTERDQEVSMLVLIATNGGRTKRGTSERKREKQINKQIKHHTSHLRTRTHSPTSPLII